VTEPFLMRKGVLIYRIWARAISSGGRPKRGFGSGKRVDRSPA
jgi:hypothetical protein